MIVAATPASICIAAGAISQLPSRLEPASRVLLVTNRHLEIDRSVVGGMGDVHLVNWSGEPDIEAIEQVAADTVSWQPNVVVGIGGGSVIDTAKALAAVIPNTNRPLIDHLEVVGAGLPFENVPLPIIAVPTTAGTGSEMTMNAVLDVPAAHRKVSLRDPRMVPRAVIVDPDLARGNPRRVANACALDAVVQLVESFATPLANPFSDLWALGGSERGLRAAARVIAGENTASTRMEMAIAAMCSGAALASSKLGTIHGFAGVVGGATGMAHGQLCGLFAAPVLRRTIERLEAEQPDHESLRRYRRLAGLTGRGDQSAIGLADWFQDLAEDADLAHEPLTTLSVSQRESIVSATQAASSTAGNPLKLSVEDLNEILDEVSQV